MIETITRLFVFDHHVPRRLNDRFELYSENLVVFSIVWLFVLLLVFTIGQLLHFNICMPDHF